MGIPTYRTSVVAVYNVEYLLLNHMCKCEPEEDGTYSIYDVKAGEQLGVTYLLRDYCLNLRGIRRLKLFGFVPCVRVN